MIKVSLTPSPLAVTPLNTVKSPSSIRLEESKGDTPYAFVT